MRAAAVALVLIVGAAVVLWYGNTLNSWVLGGLIGGLAALLLSIPISLTLFSYLSRRHEERLQAEAQEEMSLANLESYNDYPQTPVEVSATDVYRLPAQEEWYREENDYRAPRSARDLPVSVSQPRLPAPRQNPAPISENLVYHQRSTEYPLAPDRQQRPTPPSQNKGAPARRLAPGRQMRYPGFPGYQVNAQRGNFQTAALRTARQEAADQYADDTQIFPTANSKKLPALRPQQDLTAPPSRPKSPRPSRQLPPQPQAPGQYRPRRTVEGSSAPPVSRALPRAGESSANQIRGRHPHARETETDQLGERYPQTGPIRQQMQTGKTGQAARNPRLDTQRRNPDLISGSLNNPMVRRAPYMYEDDPLRQKLAQQIEAPPVRRSSRYQDYDEDEE
ncbi:MAG: hypothetical protein NVS4B7_06950 [Ktedonobacteraceae bacterium]